MFRRLISELIFFENFISLLKYLFSFVNSLDLILQSKKKNYNKNNYYNMIEIITE